MKILKVAAHLPDGTNITAPVLRYEHNNDPGFSYVKVLHEGKELYINREFMAFNFLIAEGEYELGNQN